MPHKCCTAALIALLSLPFSLFAQSSAFLNEKLRDKCHQLHTSVIIEKETSYQHAACYEKLDKIDSNMDAVCYALDADVYPIAVDKIKETNRLLSKAKKTCLAALTLKRVKEGLTEILIELG